VKPRLIEKEIVGEFPGDQSKKGAIAQALTALMESDQFTLVFHRPGDVVAEVVGYGGVCPKIIQGLDIARSYLSAELQELNLDADVAQLVALMSRLP